VEGGRGRSAGMRKLILVKWRRVEGGGYRKVYRVGVAGMVLGFDG
jgi:hypothetical protein